MWFCMNERNNNGYHKQNPNQFHNRSSYNKPYDKADKPQFETFIPIPDTTKDLLKSKTKSQIIYLDMELLEKRLAKPQVKYNNQLLQ